LAEIRERLVLHGYKEFLRACTGAEKGIAREVRTILREAGDVVKQAAVEKFDAYDVKSAHGFRTVVRARGVSIEQSLRKTTGTRPDFGALQMRKGLLPALAQEETHFEQEMEHALDLIADVFEYGAY